jgi:hypothetical protein
MAVVRWLDIVLLVISLPIFLAAGWPMEGWAVGAGAWLIQRAVQVYTNHKAATAHDARTTVGVLAGSMIGRGWFVAIAIFLVGVNDNAAGLAAAVLVVALFTVYFTVGMILRPFDMETARQAKGPSGPQAPTGTPGAPMPNGGAR